MALPNSIKGWVRRLQKNQSPQGDCSSQGEPVRDYLQKIFFLREIQPIDPEGMGIIEIDNGFKQLITRISIYEQAKHLIMPEKHKRIVLGEYRSLTRELLMNYGVNWKQVMEMKDNIIRRITRPYLFNNAGDGEPENSGTSQLLEKLV